MFIWFKVWIHTKIMNYWMIVSLILAVLLATYILTSEKLSIDFSSNKLTTTTILLPTTITAPITTTTQSQSSDIVRQLRFGNFTINPTFHTFEFNLNDSELNNFRNSNLSLVVVNSTFSGDFNNLKITINSNQFYYGIPSIGSLSQNIPRSFFKSGMNKVSFTVDPTASYNLQSVVLTYVSSASGEWQGKKLASLGIGNIFRKP